MSKKVTVPVGTRKIHPYDVYDLIESAANITLIGAGVERRKTGDGTEYEAEVSVWEIDGKLYIETATVEPRSKAGKAMLNEASAIRAFREIKG